MSKGSEQRLLELIGKVSLFSGQSQKQLKHIGKSGTERRFAAGDVIVKEGETGVGFYLILEGSVEVRKRKKVVATMSAGNFFGEMGLIDDQPRSADVVAVVPTVTFGLTPWTFAGIVTGNSDIAIKMMKIIVDRLRSTNRALSE